jgi:hypothetical protein
MGATGGRAAPGDEHNRSGELRRPRGEASATPASATRRAPDDARPKRGSERRYAGWGDAITRAYCVRSVPALPAAFPVAAHEGAATIPATIVARRPDALLLCAFDHPGPHVWPDGETAEDEITEDERIGGARAS